MKLSYPGELPIVAQRDTILPMLQQHRTLIIHGQTGSGKTTQLPKMCIEAGLAASGCIAVTQPRRLAATCMARRIAEELGVALGAEVGFSVRFSDKTSEQTVIQTMTEGILLNEIRRDPLLSRYSTILVDEAHERTVQCDIILAHLKQLQRRRRELSVIIASASLQTERFSEYFGGAPVIEVEGRSFPIELRHRPLSELLVHEESDESDHVAGAVVAVEELFAESLSGDCLVFMPTERDILDTVEQCRKRFSSQVEVLPLFSRLPAEAQALVFAPGARRRIVVATNVAETSLTIPRIRFVVDSGLARVARFSPRSKTQGLFVERISKSSCIQRAGRCGRVEAGICVRLFSEEDFQSRDDFPAPEIQRLNLAEVILRCASHRIGALEDLPLLDPPESIAVRAGYKMLFEIGAIREDKSVTRRGHQLAGLPLDPTIGAMLLKGRELNLLGDTIIIAAALSIQDPREDPPEKRKEARQAHSRWQHQDSDLLTYLQLWNGLQRERSGKSRAAFRRRCVELFLAPQRIYEWEQVVQQLEKSLAQADTDSGKRRSQEKKASAAPERVLTQVSLQETRLGTSLYDALHQAIVTGFVAHIAQSTDGMVYRASGGRTVSIFPNSGLAIREKPAAEGERKKPAPRQGKVRWIVCTDIVQTSRLFARNVAKISPDWLERVAPHLCVTTVSDPEWDTQSGRVIVRERVTLFGMEVRRRTVELVKRDPEQATTLFVEKALIEGEIGEDLSFLEKNTQTYGRVLNSYAARRVVPAMDVQDVFRKRYVSLLHPMGSRVELLHRMRREPALAQKLVVEMADFPEVTEEHRDAFPDKIEFAGYQAAVHYRCDTRVRTSTPVVRVPARVLMHTTFDSLLGAIPGTVPAIVQAMYLGLSKKQRNLLPPLEEFLAEVVAGDPAQQLMERVRSVMQGRYGITLTEELIAGVPSHLVPVVEVYSDSDVVLERGTDIAALRNTVRRDVTALPSDERLFSKVRAQYERSEVLWQQVPELPDAVTVGTVGAVPVYAYPAFKLEGTTVSVVVATERVTSGHTLQDVLCTIVWNELRSGYRALEKTLQADKPLCQQIGTFTSLPGFFSSLEDHVRQHALGTLPEVGDNQARVSIAVEKGTVRIKEMGPELRKLILAIVAQRHELQRHKMMNPGMRAALDEIAGGTLLRLYPYELLPQVPRYLRALKMRMERAYADPRKDTEKQVLTAPYAALLYGADRPPAELLSLFREYQIAIFAPEIKTILPVSEKRMKEAFGQHALARPPKRA